MRIVPYYNPAPSVVTGLCCVHLKEGTPPLRREPGAEVWLESYHAPAVLAEARRGGGVTLNSLWLDAALWNAYDGSFDMFDRIVLMPYDPNEPERAYEDNVKLLLECAARRGIPKSRLTVDLCILPYSRGIRRTRRPAGRNRLGHSCRSRQPRFPRSGRKAAARTPHSAAGRFDRIRSDQRPIRQVGGKAVREVKTNCGGVCGISGTACR